MSHTNDYLQKPTLSLPKVFSWYPKDFAPSEKQLPTTILQLAPTGAPFHRCSSHEINEC